MITIRVSLLQNFLGFGQSADIDIVFDGADNRKMAEIKTDDGKKEKYLLYYDGETVSGKVSSVAGSFKTAKKS